MRAISSTATSKKKTTYPTGLGLSLAYPIGATLLHQLSWSHVVEFVKIGDPLERSVYEKQTQFENWNGRELVRQKNTSLFQRLPLSKNKNDLIKLVNNIRQSEEDNKH
jgi:predicted transcriptional regulator